MTPESVEYLIEPLNRQHDRVAFSSGVEPLDRYLRTQARQDVDRRVAAVFVLVPAGSVAVVGYYTLSATSVAIIGLPDDIRKRLPRYPDVPATLVGRLAVDQGHRGLRLGERLLADAFDRSLRVSDEVASFAIVVDAKDEAARRFYEHYEFQPFPGQQDRLFLPMDTVSRLRAP